MLQKLFFLLYGLLWAIAKPLLKKHKRLREGYEERIIGGAWQNLAEKARGDGASPRARLRFQPRARRAVRRGQDDRRHHR